MTAEQLEDVLKEKRNQIANEVVDGKFDIDEGGEYDGRSNRELLETADNVFGYEDSSRRSVLSYSTNQASENKRGKGRNSSETDRGTETKAIKSLAEEDADNARYDLSDDNYAPTFYSQMGRVTDAIKQEKIGVKDYLSYIKDPKRGVRDEEIKWSGIEEFLEGKKSVTKAELQEFIAGSQLQIEEVTLDNNEIPYTQEQNAQIEKYENERNAVFEELKKEWKRLIGTDLPMQHFGSGLESSIVDLLLATNTQVKQSTDIGKEMAEARNQLKDMFEKDDFGYDSAHEAYKYAVRNPDDFIYGYELTDEQRTILERFSRAKENFKNAEGIPTTTQRQLKDIASKADVISKKISKIHSEHYAENAKHMTKWKQYTLKGGENYREIAFKLPDSEYSNQAMQMHWGDSIVDGMGVLVHARIQDFDVDGKKMLFIEEVQSDWHNEGHKKGYSPKIQDGRVEVAKHIHDELESGALDFGEWRDLYDELEQLKFELEQDGIDINDFLKDTVPDAPFHDNYHEYALKNLIRMAAEQGYDSIGWTPSEIQMDRWNPERLTNAEMGIEDAKNPDAIAFETAYRNEYDKRIPKSLDKWGKHWDTKVGVTTLENSDNTKIWSMDITDSMKESVLYEGQARYDVDSDTFKTQKKIEKVAQGITHDELIELAKKNTQEFVDKVKENKSLQKRLNNAKRQMLANPKPMVNVTIAGKVTKDILKEMDSTLKAKDLQEDVISIYTEYAQAIKKSGGVKSKVQEANDNMVKRFATLAVDIADNAEVFVESEMYGLIKSYIKETRIKIPDYAKNEADYAEFRKSHMGTFNLTNDGLDIDMAYQELCEMFPGMFDAEIANPTDQLYAIAEKLDGLKPYAYNPHSGYMQDAIDHIVYRFVSEADGMTAMPKTKAQKMAEKAKVDKDLALDKERENFARKLDREKAKSEKNIQALQKKINDAKYVRYWEKRLGREEKAQAIKDLRDKQQIAVLKSKIRDIVSDMRIQLNKSEKSGGYPKELVKAAADVLSAIDFHTGKTNKDGSLTKETLRLDALKMEYDALKSNPNYDFESEYSEELSDKIAKLHKVVSGKRVVDLNKTELSELKDILSEIKHKLSQASVQISKADAQADARKNVDIAIEIINELKANNQSISEIKHSLLREMKLAKERGKAFVINPHRIFEMVSNYDRDGAFWKLYEGILQGERDRKKFSMDANMAFDELTSGGANEVAFYDFRTKLHKTGIKYNDGTEVAIPKSIICEIVMLWDRKQGKNHLMSSGFKVPDLKLFNQGKTAESLSVGKMTNAITQADISRLKGMLDSYDKAWIERAHRLFNKVAKDAINKTSVALVGREIAKADNYIRIYVDSDFVKKDIGKNEPDITIEGHGSLKETTPGAKNPVVLRGLHENVYEHIDFASKYYGLAIPIRNFNKVYKISLNDVSGPQSIKSLLGSVFGPRIRDGVIVQTIKDLQSPRQREISLFNRTRGKWLGAIFWGNVKSTMKQTTSYWTASSILDESSLVKGLGSYTVHRKKTKAEIAKYSGTLYSRSQGLSTTELGDRANRKRLAGLSSKTTKAINKSAPWLRKVPEWIRPGNWLQSMDVAVSSALWDACKHQVSKTMSISDAGYMQAVVDLYERVIEETQSNYDVLQRPEILKSTNPINQTVGMFQNDNLQQTGIMYGAFNNLRAKQKAYKNDKSEVNKQLLKDAQKRMGKAIRSRIYSSVWLAFVSIMGDALLRKFKPYIDDEEKEITSQSVFDQMMLNMAEDMFGVFVPVYGQIVTKAVDTFNEGYDFLNDPSFDVMEDFIKATSKIWDAATNDKEGDILKALTDAIPAISNMTGIPAKNISDWYKAIKGYVGDIKVGEFAHDIEDYTSGNKSFYNYGDLASYVATGDKELEQKFLDYYSTDGREFHKGSFTKEIKPVFVQMYVDNPEQTKTLCRKLVLDYDYTDQDFVDWMFDEYLKNVVPDVEFPDGSMSDPEYAAEIKDAIPEKIWKSDYAYKAVRSVYKDSYKNESEDDTKALRKALKDSTGISEKILSQWEQEANEEIEKQKQELDKEKEKYR